MNTNNNFTRINIDKKIADDAKSVLSKMGLSLSSAVSALLKNISQTGEFPIHLTANYKKSVYTAMINNLLNNDFTKEDVQAIAARLSLWENNFDHKMNQELAIVLNAIFELIKKSGYNFEWNTTQPSSQYWIDNLKANAQYYEDDIATIQSDGTMTYEEYLKMFDKTINLLNNNPDYKFKYEIRCIQIPLRDWISDTDPTTIKEYLETNNRSLDLIQRIIELEKLMKAQNVELYKTKED